MTILTLTDGQQNALDTFVGFLVHPQQPAMVIAGYSGTGKSTLIDSLLKQMPNLLKTCRLLDPNMPEYEMQLTATTHKAAENFANITGMEVLTIHSFLKLQVRKNLKTGLSELQPKLTEPKRGYLLLIDEASYIDSALLQLIFEWTDRCKIIFIGDPAQLLLPRSTNAPAFCSGFPTASLTEVVRQAAGNPIVAASTMFRNVVNGEPWSKIPVDGKALRHLTRKEFGAEVKAEFLRPDWKYRDSKILCWTNDKVVEYNAALRQMLTGDPEFQVGDYAEVNAFVMNGKDSLKNGETVLITQIEPDTHELGCLGNWMTLNGSKRFFHPKTLAGRKQAHKEAKAEESWPKLQTIESWVDLRWVFAQTVNKSQGSTYDKVYIDLDDFKRCYNGNTLARLMYVGTSRARYQCNYVGDLA